MPENARRVNVAEADSGDDVSAVLIYATFPSLPLADRLTGDLIAIGLIACANLFPGMRSIYRWRGTVERDEEVAAILKTQRSLAPRVIGWLRIAHPYVNPAVVVLPIVGGSAEFLGWIASETKRAGE